MLNTSAVSSDRLGLVLAGGGARGAFQVGVINYLAEINFKPNVIAGASIGALNGAVIASTSSMQLASKRLFHLWEELGNRRSEILKINEDAKRLLFEMPTKLTANIHSWLDLGDLVSYLDLNKLSMMQHQLRISLNM